MKAIITGGSRGIGRAIASELSVAGHDVLATGRSVSNLEATAAELRNAAPGKIFTCVCDAGSRDDTLALKRYCDTIGFVPNVLVLNAGIFIEGALRNASQADFDETLRVNLFGVHHAVQVFLESMKSIGGSRVIIIGSTAAHEPYVFGPLYGVAKWALRGYAINLRRELMEDRIGVTLISPGGTLTDLWAGENLPPHRLLEPRDVAKMVTAILSLSEQAVVEEIVMRPMLGDMHE